MQTNLPPTPSLALSVALSLGVATIRECVVNAGTIVWDCNARACQSAECCSKIQMDGMRNQELHGLVSVFRASSSAQPRALGEPGKTMHRLGG